MGKPERKVRERIGSSSSYFLRYFGISRKIHSDKPIVEIGHEVTKKKRKTRPHLFWRPIKFRLKTSEIKPSPIKEKEKQSMNVNEDDKQNLYRVIRHVTDRETISASGYDAVEHENASKDTNEQKDIKPDPLNLLGYDNKCGGKRDMTKTVGSRSKPKEVKKKSLRVKKESRVDPIIGILIIMVTLMIMLMWGRLCAVLCTSTWCYFLPRLKQAATVAVSKRKRSNGDQDESGSLLGYLDLNSEAYKKKVVLEGFLDRQNRNS